MIESTQPLRGRNVRRTAAFHNSFGVKAVGIPAAKTVQSADRASFCVTADSPPVIRPEVSILPAEIPSPTRSEGELMFHSHAMTLQRPTYSEVALVLLAATLTPVATSLGQSATWTERTQGPRSRNHHAMAYDSVRAVTVLFGGSAIDRDGETWEWDGSRWTLQDTHGPSPREGHALAYDSARGRTVLFGGVDEIGQSAETWEWDGETWNLLAASGPADRTRHSLAFDAARGVTVLFGGYDASGVLLGDTWEWDGASWTLRATGGPSPRSDFAMSYDSGRGVTVLFGGFGGDDVTWEWDGTQWSQRAAGVPGPRLSSAMAYDSDRGVTVMFAGGPAFLTRELWEWDGATWVRRLGPAPEARAGHAMVFDAQRGAIVMFGGFSPDVELLGDTWQWDGSAWSLRAVSGPSARYRQAAAFDSARGAMVVFGSDQTPHNAETWEWNGTDWLLRAIAGPHGRGRSAMTYDSARGVTVLFGGTLGIAPGEGQDNDTWEWDGSSWALRAHTGPAPRRSHAMAYDSTRGVTVLFGGHTCCSGGSLPFGDTWEWDGAEWVLRATVGPPRRAWHTMAFDRDRGVTVLFGGAGGPNGNPERFADTWEWDGASWTLRDATGPAPRYVHAMAYDSARGVTVMVGGWGEDSFLRDAWEWNGTVWRQRIDAGPRPRWGHTLVYDSARDETLLFGGITRPSPKASTVALGDTWAYRETPCPGDLDRDGLSNLHDLTVLLAHFGATDDATRADGDLDADGDVDLGDLDILLSAFGSDCR